jgi:outer membrane protein assembly factor BamB
MRNTNRGMRTGPGAAARRWLGLAALTLVCGLAETARAVDDRAITDFLVPPSWAQSEWPFGHSKAGSIDYVPFAVADEVQVKWRQNERRLLVPGAATFFPPNVGADGTIYYSSARGVGFSHLDAIDPDTGAKLWSTRRWLGNGDDGTPDYGAVASAPTIDADGNLYQQDLDQFWSFTKDGQLRWVVKLSDVGGSRAWLTTNILPNGLVGGVGIDGQVTFFHPDTGALAVPVFQVPGPPGPPCDSIWVALWLGGEVYAAGKQTLYCVGLGADAVTSDTVSMDSRNGDLIIAATSSQIPDTKSLYRIRLVDYPGANAHWEIAYEVPGGPGIATTPKLSYDFTRIIFTDLAQTLRGYDADTGELDWTQQGDPVPLGSSVGPEGIIYSPGVNSVKAVDGKTGAVVWERNFDFIAQERLPTQPPIPLVIPDGTPRAGLLHTPAINRDKLNAPLILGYRALPQGANPIFVPQEYVNLVLDRFTGEILGTTDIEDYPEGVMYGVRDGTLLPSEAAIIPGLCAYVLRPVLLLNNLLTGSSYSCRSPVRGGLTAYEPVSQCRFVADTVGAVRDNSLASADAVDTGDLQGAFDAIRPEHLQLEATLASLQKAADGKELSSKNAGKAAADIEQARSSLFDARNLLDQAVVPPGDAQAAGQQMDKAATDLDRALKSIHCKGGNGQGGNGQGRS